MGSIGYALAAGNAVVFKPSEYTPGVAEWLARTFLETVGRPVFSVVTGFGEAGHALCTAGVDKIAFTGSTATGRKVMAACAETLTPVVIVYPPFDCVVSITQTAQAFAFFTQSATRTKPLPGA